MAVLALKPSVKVGREAHLNNRGYHYNMPATVVALLTERRVAADVLRRYGWGRTAKPCESLKPSRENSAIVSV